MEVSFEITRRRGRCRLTFHMDLAAPQNVVARVVVHPRVHGAHPSDQLALWTRLDPRGRVEARQIVSAEEGMRSFEVLLIGEEPVMMVLHVFAIDRSVRRVLDRREGPRDESRTSAELTRYS